MSSSSCRSVRPNVSNFYWPFGSTGALAEATNLEATGVKPDPDSSMPFPLTKLAGGMEFTDL